MRFLNLLWVIASLENTLSTGKQYNNPGAFFCWRSFLHPRRYSQLLRWGEFLVLHPLVGRGPWLLQKQICDKHATLKAERKNGSSNVRMVRHGLNARAKATRCIVESCGGGAGTESCSTKTGELRLDEMGHRRRWTWVRWYTTLVDEVELAKVVPHGLSWPFSRKIHWVDPLGIVMQNWRVQSVWFLYCNIQQENLQGNWLGIFLSNA